MGRMVIMEMMIINLQLKDDVTITYAAWNLATPQEYNIERRMINAFMVENPSVTVEVIERPKVVDEEGNEKDVAWDEFFATRASVNEMPDVFQVNQVTKVVSQGWVEDVTELAEADEDFMNVPENIRNTCYLGGKAFSLPQAVFYFGYFINRTAINETGSGAIIPKYGITYQDLMAAAKKNSKPAVLGGDAINGIKELITFMNGYQLKLIQLLDGTPITIQISFR